MELKIVSPPRDQCSGELEKDKTLLILTGYSKDYTKDDLVANSAAAQVVAQRRIGVDLGNP